MRNWSRYIQWQPATLAYPTSEAEVQALVRGAAEAGRTVRTVGSAHSFNPLWVTDEVLISLDHYQGLIEVDAEKRTARVRAGTKLYALGEMLFAHGLALENMGDIDRQSIAGTIGTGTHGTGLGFGIIPTQVIGLRLVNGQGEVVNCSATENPDLFKAAQVALGALGVITEVTLQCVPAYRLLLENRQEKVAAVLADFPSRIRDNRNFEWYWFPGTTTAWTKTSNLAAGQPDRVGLANYLTEYVLENYLFGALCEAARWVPALNGPVARISAASIPNVSKVFRSHKVYATPRLVRFNEMEYSVPLDAYDTVIREVMRVVDQRRFPVHFPIENRVVKGDDIYLSPAHGRDSAFIAAHVYAKKDFRPYFRALEEVFLAHGGRPHWGKRHTLTARQLAERYPQWEAFQAQRRAQDPEGVFLNGYLAELFIEK
ncbi:MAG: FAD-binding protein [Lewinella sp.]|nr:FAD-binding protein [Lewinella sp.]